MASIRKEISLEARSDACGGGRITNEKTARTQLTGAVVGGLGMALTEETVMDHRMGRFVNANLGEYRVPVNADVPALETFFVEEWDDHVNPVGAKGIGEVGYAGCRSRWTSCCDQGRMCGCSAF